MILWKKQIPIYYRETNTLGYGKVNGVLVAQQNNINIGRRTDGWFHFDGRISDVRFWNVARTANEIKRDKDKILTGTEPGLVGYWRLDEASGDALDSTENQNNGILTGDVVRTSEEAAVYKGGLIGYNLGTVTNSFYDSEVANLINLKDKKLKNITNNCDNIKISDFVWSTDSDKIYFYANDLFFISIFFLLYLIIYDVTQTKQKMSKHVKKCFDKRCYYGIIITLLYVKKNTYMF